MQNEKIYSVSELTGSPIVGFLSDALKRPLSMAMNLSQHYGDIIIVPILGQKIIQINHPEIVRRVLVDNQKNYKKGKPYIRFKAAIGEGLLTSNGEKWKRDRQKIQPMFNREQIAGYYFDITNFVSEKYKKRWLLLTEHGKTEINITEEMAKITTEVILRSIFGNNISDATIDSLNYSYNILIEYLKNMRVFYNIDSRKLFCHPAYFRFKKELENVEKQIKILSEKYRDSGNSDKYNMLSLLIAAQKTDPSNFNEKDIRDHAVSMVFAGFETTAVLMQWVWYALDDRSDITEKLRADIAKHIPCASDLDSSKLSFNEIKNLEYMPLVLKETMRLYPPFWMTGREAVEDDYWGNFKVRKGTTITIPQIAMHRHPRFWNNPNSFIPERFLPENEKKIDDGIYFPFLHGGRKCSGYQFVDMEMKTVISKLLPFFSVKILNKMDNCLKTAIAV